jgi:ribosomal protein S18 acetylase RimI-like enzyme
MCNLRKGWTLSFRFESLLADPDWVLAHFTLAADLTTLQDECRFAHAEEAVVARYEGLPFPALAFLGQDPGQLSGLAAQLVGPDEPFYLLLNEGQAQVAERAFAVEQAHPEWQMLFAGDPAGLDPGGAVGLGPANLEALQDLAADAGLMALEADPFRYGPAFGVWEAGRLVAMGATHLQVPGAAEIGNVAARTTHRRRGYARQVVAALVQAHVAEGRRVFLMVFQTNHPAVRLYERLGFVRLRPMFLMRCRLRSDVVGQTSEVSSHF